MSKEIWLLACLILCIISNCFASTGDEQSIYNSCVDECVQATCPALLTFFLRLFHWSCPENCRYICMQAVTDMAEKLGLPILQYYGKWPFYRWLGIQEPASVIFSIGNGLVHLFYFWQLKTKVPQSYPFKGFTILYTCIGINAWFWSTLFHMRDVKVTEMMDYFSATLLILYSLFYAIIRVCAIQNYPKIKRLSVFLTFCFAAHVSYLIIFKFDYSYNMYANVIVGMLQVSLWVGWYIQQQVKPENCSRRSYAHHAVITVFGVSLAMCLELFDFPPLWRVFDAHSLWHCTTIPLSIIWYQFLLNDARHEAHNAKPYSPLMKAVLPS